MGKKKWPDRKPVASTATRARGAGRRTPAEDTSLDASLDGFYGAGGPSDPVAVMCAKCGSRPGNIQWVGEGGYLAFSHGMYAMWCLVCATEAQLEYAQRQAATVPGLEAKLARVLDYEQQHQTLEGFQDVQGT